MPRKQVRHFNWQSQAVLNVHPEFSGDSEGEEPGEVDWRPCARYGDSESLRKSRRPWSKEVLGPDSRLGGSSAGLNTRDHRRAVAEKWAERLTEVPPVGSKLDIREVVPRKCVGK